MKNELKRVKRQLSADYPECFKSQSEVEEEEGGKQRRREAFLTIAQHFLRSMNQEELADRLQSGEFYWDGHGKSIRPQQKSPFLYVLNQNLFFQLHKSDAS